MVTLVAMVLVAVLVALVVDRAARRAQQAARARTEAALLASFARTVLTRVDPLPRLLEKVREAFGLPSWRCWSAGTDELARPSRMRPARSTAAGPTRPTSTSPSSPDLHLVGTGRSLPAADRRLLEVVGGQALLALRSERAPPGRPRTQRRAEATEARSALLVGGRARPAQPAHLDQGRGRQPARPAPRLTADDRPELTATIDESADRLTGLVDNLLDSSRLAAGCGHPAAAPIGYDEVAAARCAASLRLDGRAGVKIDIAEPLPDVLADPGLLERVIANLVDNALRHAAGAPMALRASAMPTGRAAHRRHGPGRAAGKSRDLLFTPFQRLGDRRRAHAASGWACPWPEASPRSWAAR